MDEDEENQKVVELLKQAFGSINGWPLDKQETFAAFALMGLASRLQPLQVESSEHQARVSDLAYKLGTMTAEKFGKEDA
jgi:hypothetical protein